MNRLNRMSLMASILGLTTQSHPGETIRALRRSRKKLRVRYEDKPRNRVQENARRRRQIEKGVLYASD